MKKNNSTKVFLLLGVAIILIAFGILVLIPSEKKTLKQTSIPLDVAYAGPKLGGDFVLQNSENQLFDSKSQRGKLMLLYFGFTFCPDICPASLGAMQEASAVLKAYNKYIQFFFITIDPKRDTAIKLKNYFAPLNGLIVPLTGSDRQIKEVADLFKVYYSISQDDKRGTEHYLLNHSSFYYLIDQNGNFLKIYPSGVSGIEMGYDLLKIIKERF